MSLIFLGLRWADIYLVSEHKLNSLMLFLGYFCTRIFCPSDDFVLWMTVKLSSVLPRNRTGKLKYFQMYIFSNTENK